MAPEQFHPGPNDARADVYALGCVLFAALTGAPPFLRETVPATMLAHLHDKPPRASLTAGVPAGFDRVLARALAKSPEDRYPSAGDFGRAAHGRRRGPLGDRGGALGGARRRGADRAPRGPAVVRAEAAAAGRARSGRRDQVPPEPAEPAPIRTLPRAPPAPPVGVGAPGVGAIAAAAVALAVVPGGADTPQPGEPVSSGDVERMANSFASAYADEDAARISRLLTVRRPAHLARRQPGGAAQRRRGLREPVRRQRKITGLRARRPAGRGRRRQAARPPATRSPTRAASRPRAR